MKDRLYEIECNALAIYEKPAKHIGFEISKEDYEWLVQCTKNYIQVMNQPSSSTWTYLAIQNQNKDLQLQVQEFDLRQCSHALEFYANKENYEIKRAVEPYIPIVDDGGHKAKEALEYIKSVK